MLPCKPSLYFLLRDCKDLVQQIFPHLSKSDYFDEPA